MQTLARLGSQWAAVSCLLADTLPHTAASPPHAASHGGAGVVEAQRQAAGAEPAHAPLGVQQLQQQVAVLEREGEELRRGRAVAEKERDAARVELEAMRAGAAVGGAAREVALMKEAEVAAVETGTAVAAEAASVSKPSRSVRSRRGSAVTEDLCVDVEPHEVAAP